MSLTWYDDLVPNNNELTNTDGKFTVKDHAPRRSSSKKSTKSTSNVSFANQASPEASQSQGASTTSPPNVHTHVYSDVHQCSCGDVHSTPSGKRLSSAGKCSIMYLFPSTS